MTSSLEVARPVVYRFDRFELLPETEELRKNGTRIHLPPQPFRVLLLLVQRSGEIVTREEIQEALWGSEVFVDYEQGINTAIRRIRFALNDNAETPRFLQTLPRRGYCFVMPVERVVAAGPSPAPAPQTLHVVEAWTAPPQPQQPRRFARFAPLLVLIALLFATRAPHGMQRPAPAQKPAMRVAVGPVTIDRMRPAAIDANRVAGELRAHLARLQPQLIHVVAPGEPADVRIEGVLQDAGSAIQIDARIIETHTGRAVRTETINREGDASDFPLEIALRLTQAVAAQYIPPGREEPIVRTKVSPAVSAMYREARNLRARPQPQQDMDGALVRFQKAVEIEPKFAEAWSGIGDIWSERATAWFGESRAVALTQARIALERSIALDPKGPEALNDYGRLLMQHDRDYAAAETWLRRAIAADPEYTHSHFNLASLLAAMGEHERAIEAFRQVQRLDPNQWVPSGQLGFLYLMGHRYDDAMAEYRSALLVGRNPFAARWGMMWSAMAMRRWDVAARSLAAVLEEPVDLGDHPDSGARYREEFRRLEPILLARERAKRLDPYILACYYSMLQDSDRAFQSLDKAIADNSLMAIYTYVDPRLEFIRADPRFEERLVRLAFRR